MEMGSELDFGVVFSMGECTEFVFGSFPEMSVGDCVPLQLCFFCMFSYPNTSFRATHFQKEVLSLHINQISEDNNI